MCKELTNFIACWKLEQLLSAKIPLEWTDLRLLAGRPLGGSKDAPRQLVNTSAKPAVTNEAS